MLRSPAWVLIIALGTAFPALASLSAQTPTAGITGVVADTSGAPIEAAEVVATNLETGLAYRTKTGSSGEYWLGGLRPGRYDVSAGRMDFPTVVRSGNEFPVGQTLTLDFVLEVQVVELEAIEVVAERPLVETTQSDLAFVIDQERIERMPEESRDFVDLAVLAPGATATPSTFATMAKTQVGGLNSQSLAVLVDGGNLIGGFNHQYTGGFPLSAIQEFEVLHSSYSAEFGQAASGVINAVTRGGTNDLVVEGFVRYRHRRLNARGVNETGKPDFNRQHWGGAVGGPLRRDRTHYFVAFERKVENTFATVETGGVFPAWEGTFKTPSTTNQLFLRLDHRFSPAHETMIRYGATLTDARVEVGGSSACLFSKGGPQTAAEYGVDWDRRMHSVLATHRWAISEVMRNEVSVHYARLGNDRRRITDDPALVYLGRICGGGNHFAWENTDSRLAIDESLSIVASGGTGTHRLKVGARFSLVDATGENSNLQNGSFEFSSTTAATPESFRQFLDPIQATTTNGQIGVYLQDDWSPIPTLTLNLGLRYDIESNGVNRGFVSTHTQALPFVPKHPRARDMDNIAPRLGVAWDVGGDGRTVVRGGFGIFYDQMAVWQGQLERSGVRVWYVLNPGTTDPEEIPTGSGTVRPALYVLDTVMPTPSTRQYSLGVERVMPGGVVARLDGILVKGRNLTLARVRNPFEIFSVRKYPQFDNIFEYLNRGKAEEKALIVQVRKRFPWGRVDLHYTLADRKTTTDWWLDVLPVSDTTYDFSSEFGPADWDERHRVVFLADAELRDGMEGALKLIYSSPRPFTRTSGKDDNNDKWLTDRPEGESRNARRGPDFFRVDLGVGWYRRWGRADVGITFSVYNLLNRTNLNPASVVGNAQLENYGEALAAFAKRQGEVGLRVRF